MITKDRLITRYLSEIAFVPTSHKIGYKQVLLGNDDTDSQVTQIAKTKLRAGCVVEDHAHPSMDEHFLFIDGGGVLIVDGRSIECVPGLFVLVPAQARHSLTAYTDLNFITFSVAL